MKVGNSFYNKLIQRYLLLSFGILIISCSQKNNEKLTIATAANMQFAMKELAQSFTKETGIDCEIIIGSSGRLTAQIKEGAPFDVFVSADMKFPQELYNYGLTIEKPVVYAYGKLVLWTMNEGLEPSIELLIKDEVGHIALANPKTAPYGVPAVEVLNQINFYDKVESKLVFGESIAQTNQFITSKVADIGFTSKSVVLTPQMKGKGNWIDVDENLYTPISQGIVVLNSRKQNLGDSELFYKFLLSEKGKEILSNFGYSVD